ncbi:MAG TPA: hydroxyacid dehydrogenase [Acidobacteriaceae bacterium]|nr:hydroxyacid dehydrogenase [Acidobacteriaceae bacterium]
MPDILIAENLRGAAVDVLRSRFDVTFMPELWKYPAKLLECVGDFRALLVRNQTDVNAAVIGAGKKLIVIGRAGVGLDNVDVAAATKAEVLVTSTPDQNAISVAELAIGLMISLARMIPAANLDTKNGNWNRLQYVGTELYGKTFGIVGAGKIGYLTARRAQALGMKVLASDPFISRDNILLSELNAELVSLDDLLARADVVSCHLPSTAETQGIFNAERFAKMKPTATFLNTSRGEVVVERDLLDALKSGGIAGAAIDVRMVEPPVAGELEQLPNLILTPHIAAFTQEAQDRVMNAICDDVTRVLEGKSAQNAVNRV